MKYLEIELNDGNKGYLNPDTNKSEITFINNFLDKETTEKLFNNLTKTTPWEQGVYKMFGRDVKTPRLLWAMRDDKFDVEKSYTVTGSSIWNEDIKKIKTKVEKIIKKNIKYAQINYYRDGNDYIGWHTDSEVMKGDLIASISIGATRKFQFQPIDKNNKETNYEIELTNGSLIIFDESAAKTDWKHRIPKQPKIEEGRINITFRLR
jgi:alkylated DNA repair dioxygenase AlkB